MKAIKILSRNQAETAYAAMRTLDTVAGRIYCTPNESITVEERISGGVWVIGCRYNQTERYEDRAAFAAAYGLE